MPHLMIDLGSVSDCEKGLELLRRRLGRGCGKKGVAAGARSDWAGEVWSGEQGAKASPAQLPLPQKLKRIQHRGMWKHLVKIARNAPQPLSLPELDELLELPKNKMRSLKANMAKLENRFAIKFLIADPDAGVDGAGNPRYLMPPNVRRQILRLTGESSLGQV
jgi:hypothetical protein